MADRRRSCPLLEDQGPDPLAVGTPQEGSSIRTIWNKTAGMAILENRFGYHAFAAGARRAILCCAVCARNERRRKMKRARHQRGSVVFDRRRKVWNYLFCENGSRRTRTIGPLRDYPTKASAWAAVETIKQNTKPRSSTAPSVRTLVEQFRAERMPQRFSTQYGYEAWIRNHILPRWGNLPLTELQPRPVELWLKSLTLSPKSRSDFRTRSPDI